MKCYQKLLAPGLLLAACGSSGTDLIDFAFGDMKLANAPVAQPGQVTKPQAYMEALHFDTEPAGDGILDESIYQQVNAFQCFVDNTNRRFAEQQTTCWLYWSAQGLHIALESPDTPGDVQLWFRLPGQSEPLRLQIDMDGSVSCPPGIVCGGNVANGCWSVELTLPFAALARLAPRDGETWQYNIVRYYRESKTSTSLVARWNPAATIPADNEYARLVFRHADRPVIRLLECGDPARREMDFNIDYIENAATGKLWAFVDVIVSRAAARFAMGNAATPDEFSRMRITPETLAGGSTMAISDGATISILDSTFSRVFFATDFLPFGAGRKIDPVHIELHKPEQTAEVEVEFRGLSPELLGQCDAVIRLLDDTKEVCHQTLHQVSAEVYRLQFPFALLAPGHDYTVEAILVTADGRELERSSNHFLFPDTSIWMDNQLGISDQVPEPFEPLTLTSDHVIGCWERSYHMADGTGFPSRITALKRELLAAPIRLHADIDGAEIAFPAITPTIDSSDATKITFHCESEADGLRLRVSGTAEYDGMIRLDFALKNLGTPDRMLDRLELRIPMTADRAKYLAYTNASGAGQMSDCYYYGARPAEGVTREFMPFIWLGDDDRGLLWFCESARNWNRADPAQAFTVTPEHDGSIELILKIVSRPVRMDRELDYTMGLQATPVRSRPDNWREMEEKWVYTPTDQNYFGFIPEATAMWKDKVAGDIAAGRLLSAYSFFNVLSTKVPEYDLFFDEWKRTPSSTRSVFSEDAVNPEPQSWRDFIVWSYVEGMRRWNVDGVYYDLGWPSPNSEAYRNEYGQWDKHWPIFACREITKRAYTAFRQERRKQTAFIGHISCNPIVLPIVGFCDIMLDGEQFSQVLKGGYAAQISPDRMRTEFTCRQFGPLPLFLPEIKNSGNPAYNTRDEAPTEELYALMYLHDVMIWPSYVNNEVAARYTKPKMEFIRNAAVEFVPYWENTAVRSDNPETRIAYYRKPGALLVIVANLTPQTQNVTLTLDPGLGEGHFTVTDCATSRPTGLEQLNIAPKSMRMLKITFEKEHTP